MIYRIARWLYRAAKYPLNLIRTEIQKRNTRAFVSRRAALPGVTPESFHFADFKRDVLRFLESRRTGGKDSTLFLYSTDCQQPNLYASVYAFMTFSLLGEAGKFTDSEKRKWVEYFDSFQRESDGHFIDTTLRNNYYDNEDWWGARHLALHMITAYTALGAKPRYPFRFQEIYYNLDFLEQWLKENDDKFQGRMDNAFDNKLMNIGCVLQYQRDFWNDRRAGEALKFMQDHLLRKINPRTGIWGDDDITDPDVRSRKVQFAYHLFPLYFYDNLFPFDLEKVVNVTLRTENEFGGFAPHPNSSACEDIDSIDIIIRLSTLIKHDERIAAALRKAFTWILRNQMSDGGFVFKLNEPFVYGHAQLSAQKNTGAVFPTWFRTLSIAYLAKALHIPHDFKLVKCPGYEF